MRKYTYIVTSDKERRFKRDGMDAYRVTNKYFLDALDIIARNQTRKWGKWKSVDEIDFPYNDSPLTLYRTNGKKVEIKSYYMGKVIKGRATCCDGDTFDLSVGVTIAYCRMASKLWLIKAEEAIDNAYGE